MTDRRAKTDAEMERGYFHASCGHAHDTANDALPCATTRHPVIYVFRPIDSRITRTARIMRVRA